MGANDSRAGSWARGSVLLAVILLAVVCGAIGFALGLR